MKGCGAWLAALGAGVVCGLAGAAFSAPAGEALVRARHVSNFEGGAGYLIAFVLLPLGFVVGLVTGVVVVRARPPADARAFALRQGRALLITIGLLTLGYAVAVL